MCYLLVRRDEGERKATRGGYSAERKKLLRISRMDGMISLVQAGVPCARVLRQPEMGQLVKCLEKYNACCDLVSSKISSLRMHVIIIFVLPQNFR